MKSAKPKQMDLEKELKLARRMNAVHVMHAAEDAAFIEMLVEAWDGLYEQYEFITDTVISSAEANINSSEHATQADYAALEMVKMEASANRVTNELMQKAYEAWKKSRS